MSNTTDQVTTAEQLAAMPDDGNRYELVKGVLHMMSPAGRRHGRVAARLNAWVTVHVDQRDLGETYAAETGFLIQRHPDTVRAPDVAFVSRDRLAGRPDDIGFLPLAPDFVAEVVSPNDQPRNVEAKSRAWIDAGVRVVLVIDPQTSTVREYRSGSAPRTYSSGLVDLGDILPGFQLDVTELFA